MDWSRILIIVQVASAVLMVIGILLQGASGGMEGALGSTGSSFERVKKVRRGFEKFLFEFTIVISVVFVASFILDLVI